MGRPQQPCHHRVNILRYLHRLHLLRSSFETQSGGLGRILCPWQFVYFPAVVVWTGYVWRIVLAGHRLDHLLFTCWIRCVITLSTAQQHTRSTPSSYTLSTSLSTHPTNSPHQQTLSIQAAHPIYLNPILIIFLVSLCFMLLLPCCLVVLFFVCLFIFCSVSCCLFACLFVFVLCLLFFVLLGIAIVNDFKSIEGDRALGLQSLPVTQPPFTIS